MLAVYLTGHGGLEKLVVDEQAPKPEPSREEVLIKVGACAINNTDIWTREGAYGSDADPSKVSGWRREPMQFPRIQGVDIAGRIEAVGEGVAPERVGERVVVDGIVYSDTPDGLEDCEILGSERDGGYAEYVAVPSVNAIAITSDYTDAELASFPTAYGTAEGMLGQAAVDANDTILITGASGGVGSALVQLANLRGARTIAVVGPGKEEQVKALGADAVLQRGSALTAQLDALRLNSKVDVVADVVGGPGFPELLNLLRHRGRYVTAGAIAGPVVQLDLRTVYLKYLELIGSTMWRREEFVNLVGYIQDKRIKPLVWQTFALREVHRAQTAFTQKKFLGKLVLIPSG